MSMSMGMSMSISVLTVVRPMPIVPKIQAAHAAQSDAAIRSDVIRCCVCVCVCV